MAASGLKMVSVRLAPRVQEGGRFSLHLVGRQKLDTTKPDVSIALFQPIGADARRWPDRRADRPEPDGRACRAS